MKQLLFTFIGFVILLSSCQNQPQNNQNKNQITEENLDDMEMMEAVGAIQQENVIIDKDYFKKFDKVELAYYPHSVRSYGTMPACKSLIKNGVFEVDSLQKKVALSQIQIKQFEQIAFSEPNQNEWQPSDCFRPRHSLIFYEKEKATHIIEICFDCSDVCYYPNAFPNMNLVYKFEEMEKLFNKILKN